MSRVIGWLAAGAVLATILGCGRAAATSVPQRVKLLSRVVVADSTEALVESYNRSIPGIESSLQTIPGSEYVVNALQDGDAELGFAQADVVYSAYRSGTAESRMPFDGLRAIAIAQRASVIPVVRDDRRFHTIADLRGRRIGIDPTGSSGEVYARLVLEAYGLRGDNVSLTHLLPDRMAAGVRDGTLDAAMFVGSSEAAIAWLKGGVAIRFLDIDRARINALRDRYPFMTPTLITAAEAPGASTDTHTVGIDNVLVCRGDLAEDLVYQLTVGLFAESDRLQKQNPTAPPWIDIERAPATPIPLHAGAARYYRERQILQ